MQDITKLPQVILHMKLQYLVPDAAFDVRPYDLSNPLCEGAVILYGQAVTWDESNVRECPTEKEIDRIDLPSLDSFYRAKEKEARNKRYEHDLSVLAALDVAQKTEPDLKLGDYLDRLEAKMKQKN